LAKGADFGLNHQTRVLWDCLTKASQHSSRHRKGRLALFGSPGRQDSTYPLAESDGCRSNTTSWSCTASSYAHRKALVPARVRLERFRQKYRAAKRKTQHLAVSQLPPTFPQVHRYPLTMAQASEPLWCYCCDRPTSHEARYMSELSFTGKLLVCNECGETIREPIRGPISECCG